MRWLPSGRTDSPLSPEWITAKPYAHRGLHGTGRPENSRAAFAAAVEAGFGIELDVRASRCGTAFVFHDQALDRLCGATGMIDELDREALAAVTFRDGGETIPTLTDVLALIGGRVPVLIELKSFSPTNHGLCWAVADDLAAYAGPAAVMSFDPALVSWFARNAPAVVRGLVVSEEGGRNLKGLLGRSLGLMFARPRFLAYDVRSLPSRFAARSRAFGMPILTWTVRSDANRETAEMHADQIIFEKYKVRG
jgi:glycerophosphoryl diester phosphodiesterase